MLLTIGAWWGKLMGVPGEDDPRVIDGVEFLRRVNNGERPEMPETVAVIGGGDVAMDACRACPASAPAARTSRLSIGAGPTRYRRARSSWKARSRKASSFVYNTRQTAITKSGNGLALQCVRTEAGQPDADGRRRPVDVAGSEHAIDCGMVIASVGQYAASDELDQRGLMDDDRVRAEFDGMRTSDPKVFAAGDGAFGGSTIVMAMHHGQTRGVLCARLPGRA